MDSIFLLRRRISCTIKKRKEVKHRMHLYFEKSIASIFFFNVLSQYKMTHFCSNDMFRYWSIFLPEPTNVKKEIFYFSKKTK